MINVTVWNENLHEKQDGIKDVMKLIHRNRSSWNCGGYCSRELGDEVNVRTATLDEPEQGTAPDEIVGSDGCFDLVRGHGAHHLVEERAGDQNTGKSFEGNGADCSAFRSSFQNF